MQAESLKKSKKIRGKNGGARPGAGRPKIEELQVVLSLKEKVKRHGLEEVNLKTREGQIIKLTRIEALLEKLYELGLRGNTHAIAAYLDRTAGPVAQLVGEDPENKFSSFSDAVKSMASAKPKEQLAEE